MSSFARCLVLLLLVAPESLGAARAGRIAHVAVYSTGSRSTVVILNLDGAPADPSAIGRAVEASIAAPVQYRHEAAYPNGGWSLAASFEAPVRRPGETAEVTIDPAPLLAALGAEGAGGVSFSLSHPASGFSECPGAERVDLGELEPDESGPMAAYSVDVAPGTAARPITMRFAVSDVEDDSGFYDDARQAAPAPPPPEPSAAEAARVIAPLAALVLLPVAAALWRRRGALRDAARDREAAWCGYWLFLNFTGVVTFLAWLFAVGVASLSPLGRWVAFETGRVGALPAAFAIYLVPPLSAIAAVYVVSYPVLTRVRGLSLSRGEAAALSLLGTVAGLLPVGFFVAALQYGFTEGVWHGVAWFAAGVCSLLALAAARRRLMLDDAQALTTGPLRDRVFQLAEYTGVAIQQLFVTPAGRLQMANALAATGNRVTVTAPLIEHLSRRELDAVLMHELAHLRLNHPRIISFAWAFSFVLGTFFFMFAGPAGVPVNAPLLCAAAFTTGFFVYLWVRRRLEFSADRSAVEWGRDPEALVTALVKIGRLNMMPGAWGRGQELILTHPSTERRARAIARRCGIPADRLGRLLEGALGDESRYEAGIDVDARPVFSAAAKARVVARHTWAALLLASLVPALAAALVSAAGLAGAAAAAGYAAGALAAAAAAILSTNVTVVSGYAALGARLRARLGTGRPAEGALVGFAPDAAFRVYEGFFDWDLGLLDLRDDVLAYTGERAAFTLRRDQVARVWLDRPPGWFPVDSLFVAWRDDGAGASGVFNVRAHGGGSARAAARDTRALAARMSEWLARPQPPAESRPPAYGPVTSASVGESVKVSQTLALAVVAMLLAAVASAMAGLSFFGAGAWAAILSAALATVALRLPQLRGKAASRQSPVASRQ